MSGRIGSPAPPVENYKPSRALLRPDVPLSDGGFSDAGRSEDSGSYSMFNVKRYRRYFNVDTGVGAKSRSCAESVMSTFSAELCCACY